MKRLIAVGIVSLVLLHGAAWGQANRRLDSLEALVKNHTQIDQDRVKALIALAAVSNSAQPQKATALAREALRAAQGLNYPMGQAAAYTQLATCFYERGDLDSAKVLYEGALRLYKAQTGANAAKVQPGIVRVQNGLASVYAIKGKFDPALKLFIQNLTIAERLGDKRMQLQSLANMGALAEQMLDDERALRYYNQALALADSVENAHEYETSLANIAGMYSNEKKYALAAAYANRALKLTETSGDAQNRGTMQNVLGQVSLAKNNVADARQRFGSALKLGQQVGDNYLVSRSLLLLGQAALQQKQYPVALQYYQKALPVLLEVGVSEHIRDAYQGLGLTYAALGQFEKAARNQQKQIAFGDSATNEKRLSETRLLQTRYDTERKEARNRLQAAQLRTQQQVIRRRNVQLLAGLTIAGLLAGLAYLLYTRRRLRREVEFAQERQALDRQRAAAVLAAEEAERHRIGADLHDGIGQLLSVVKINMNGLCEELRPRLEADEAQRFGDALDLVDESVREVRGISHNLLPNALIKRGLARAVREFLDKLQRPGRLKIRLETLGLDAPRLDPTVESALYRVIQELVQNIIKHAQATEVEMQIIRHAHELTLLVEDNGVGFDVPTHGAGDGVGLQSVGSRVAYLGGTLHVDSRIGRGTTVTATVPM